MPFALSLVPWVALHAATLSASSLPAKGHAEATLTLDTPGYVRVRARSGVGTSCELVDPLRGPFARSGVRGKRSCDRNLLLDAGAYRVRLESPVKGKGLVTLSAEPFAELHPQPVTLRAGNAYTGTLPEQTQASYAFRLDRAGPVLIRVAGRTAGDVQLWRAGEFVEPATWRRDSSFVRGGQPVHEAWLSKVLEAGDYRLTAYGTDALTWTEGTPEQSLSVHFGFPLVPAQGGEAVTLPASGFWAVEVPKGPLAAAVLVQSTLESSLQMGVFGQAADGAAEVESPESSCFLERKAQWRECALFAGSDRPHVLWVRGPPGTQLTTQWAPVATTDFAEGAYGPTKTEIRFEAPTSGDHLLATHDVPADTDGAPLSCALLEEDGEGQRLVARDAVTVRGGKLHEQSFNYDGEREVIDFRITSGGTYRIRTSGQRKTQCELYALSDVTAKRLGESGKCDLTLALTPGFHQLALHDGTAGIETLRIGPPEASGTPLPLLQPACLFPRVKLAAGGRYVLQLSRDGAAAARGVHLRRLPLELERPLPLLVRPGAPLSLPLDVRSGLIVRGSAEPGLRCAWGDLPATEAVGGTCTLGASPSRGAVLRLETTSTKPAAVVLLRSPAVRPVPPTETLALRPLALPTLTPDAPAFFSLERGGTHSRVFQVQEAGLYDVATEGLLATRCLVRTPVVPQLFENTGGGRGRNSAIASYLRPGRYVVTVAAEGQSRGRASLRLSRRPARDAEPLGEGEQRFFRVQPEELIAQRLTIRQAGPHQLSTVTTSGGALACRLEDADGWPLLASPGPCTLDIALRAGEYRWMQLPAGVETQRRTQLEKTVRSKVLRGPKPHPIALETDYTVALDKGGKDTFELELSADTQLGVQLSNGMQGRLYRADDAARAKVLAVIPPASASEALPPSSNEGLAGGEGETDAEGEWEGEGGDEVGTGSTPTTVDPSAIAEAAEPSGSPVSLPAGKYRLVTEHSRGDVAIRYSLRIGSRWLLPGVSRELSIPVRVPVRVPTAGVLRLTTQGNADVRCRLLTASGGRLAESGERGPDWNCALAEPLPAGDHLLVLESENGLGGITTVRLEAPRIDDVGETPASATWKVADGVLRASLPAATADTVQSVELSAKSPFSCALEDAEGRVIEHRLQSTRCDLHLQGEGRPHHVRVWSLGEPVEVAMRSRSRRIEAGSAGGLPAGVVRKVTLARAGRYATGDEMLCGRDRSGGVLRPCGTEASLEAGSWLFTSTKDSAVSLSLDERVRSVDTPVAERLALARTPFVQRQSARAPSVHLLSAQLASASASPGGERGSPACAFAGGVTETRPGACHAASAVAQEAEARAWIAGDTSDVEVTRRAVSWPGDATSLSQGAQALRWKGPTRRFRLPAGPHRVDWTVPADAWAVQLDAQGKPVGLCPPEPSLHRCRFFGQGGDALVYSPRESHAEAELVLLESLPPPRTLAGLFEDTFHTSGVLRFDIAPTDSDRRFEALGATGCVLERDDGSREEGCDLRIAPGARARLQVDHRAGPLRLLLDEPSPAGRASRIAGSAKAQGETKEWSVGQRLVLDGAEVQRTLVLTTEGSVRVLSDSGVCSLRSDKELLEVGGDGNGCRLHHVLAPGRYTVHIRAFGSSPLRGGATWVSRPVEPLKEGVGGETWVAPDETRVFRFSTASAGKIGLGIQAGSDALDCVVLDASQRPLGDGCQQLLAVPKGSFFLTVSLSQERSVRAQRFRPVLVGLAGAKAEVPREYLEAFFERTQPSTSANTGDAP